MSLQSNPGAESEAALRESEQRLRLVFDNAGEIMAIVRVEPGPVFRMSSLNRRYLEVVRAAGYDVQPGDLIGKTLEEVILGVYHFPRELYEYMAGKFREAVASPQPVRYDEIKDAPNGRWYGEATLTAIPDSSGRCAYVLYTSRDVTARKQAEAELRHSEELFRAVVRDQTDMIVRWKPDGTRTFVNAAYCRFFGQTPEQMIGTSFLPLVAEEFREAILAKLKSLTPANPVAYDVHRSITPAGEELWQEWTDRGIFDEHGQLVELQSVGRDITERKRSEAQARELRQRFDLAVSGSSAGLWDWNLQTKEIFYTARMKELLGYQDDEFPNTVDAFVSHLHPDDMARVRAHVKAHLNHRSPYNIEYRLRTKEGGYRWFNARAQALWSAEGTPMRMAGSIIDISEAKHAESRLRRLNRLYAVSSSINEAIVRLRDPQKLYQAACRIAVEQGALVMAWVGLLDEAEGVLRPACSWGNDRGFTAMARVSLADGALGGGAAGMACSSGTYSVANDLARDPGLAMWREAALSRGYRSNAAFPLKVGGRVTGVISMYADQPDFFNADEVQLLTALAENLAFGVDLSEREEKRRQATAALDENQRVLATLLGNLPGMAYRCRNDEFWTMELVSEGCRELTGYAPEELLQNRRISYELITHPDDRAQVREQINLALAARRRFDLEYRIRDAAGAEKWVWERGVGVFAPDGTLICIEGFISDVSERRVAEQRVKEQAALLDKARDAIIVRDLDDTVLYWNKSAETLYGIPAAEARGRRVTELLYRERTAFEEARRTVLAKGEWNGILHQFGRQGREVVVDSSWTLVLDEAGQPKSVLAINTDITERRKLEAQFLRAQRVENIGTLAGGIAHDLNNVLAPILMAIEILKTKVFEPEDEEVLETLRSSAQRGAQLIRQILSFARGAEGQRTSIEPRGLIREVHQICQDTFPKSIQIQAVIPPDVWNVEGDQTQLHQVLLNLCVNARDAMPGGGVLSLAAGNFVIEDTYAARFPNFKPGPQVVFTVSDTGAGIPEAILEKIFDPFFTTKAVGKGTGLGLATVQSIVKNHGGFVQVASQPGKGSVFTVYLPARTGAAAPAPPKEPAKMPAGQGELVLVIDDEAAIRTVAQRSLERFGYRVLTARDGAEGVEIFAQRHGEIAVVVTDMMMPVMDGPAAVVEMLKIDPGACIIAASGYSSPEVVAKVMESGVKHFLPKPYTTQTLLNLLKEVLAQGTEQG